MVDCSAWDISVKPLGVLGFWGLVLGFVLVFFETSCMVLPNFLCDESRYFGKTKEDHTDQVVEVYRVEGLGFRVQGLGFRV